MASARATPAPFVERMVHFWSNHFAVSADNTQVMALAGAFEREAIRPHVLGRFETMLQAVERHPAMLVYLSQVPSTGPHSPASTRAAAAGRKAPASTRTSRARSWNSTRWACARAIPRPT
jgi:uncharacterized protein (DUF1800 family)